MSKSLIFLRVLLHTTVQVISAFEYNCPLLFVSSTLLLIGATGRSYNGFAFCAKDGILRP